MTLLEKKSLKSIYIPDYAGIFTAYASVQAGLKPILTDVEKNGSLKLGNQPKFIVHSNGRLGKPLDMCSGNITSYKELY